MHKTFRAVQVTPRPVLTNVALQVPVLAADASSVQLEADLLKGNLQVTHTRLQLADLVGPPLHMMMHVSLTAKLCLQHSLGCQPASSGLCHTLNGCFKAQ